jgi:hypothetical protein
MPVEPPQAKTLSSNDQKPKGGLKNDDAATLLQLIGYLGVVPQEQLFAVAKSNGVGQKKVRSLIRQLKTSGKLEEVKVPRGGKKSGISYRVSGKKAKKWQLGASPIENFVTRV